MVRKYTVKSDELNIDDVLHALNDGSNPLDSISVFESIDSTNDWCLQQCGENKTLPFACIADRQVSGKGRRGRHWVSASGTSITMSFATRFDLASHQLGMLAISMGMAVVNVLRSLKIKDVMLKWPNDIIINNKKIAGILIETINVNNRLNVVVGVGINYDMSLGVSSAIDVAWTDVKQCFGQSPEGGRNQLAGKLLQECLAMCGRYQQDYNFLSTEFDSNYNAYINVPVNVLLGGGEIIEGVSLGTTEQGELRVLVGSEEQVFNSAEISLRQGASC